MRRTLSSNISVKKQEENEFGQRFAEACASEEPARIGRFLNISYQAAKNYLGGRLPEPRVLLRIAENTPYSIHWLLTGEGEKFVRQDADAGTVIPASEIKAMVREACAEVINEVLTRRGEPRVVLLDPMKIKSERVYESEPVYESELKTHRS
jgi:hypothetical protein